jgi:ribonuclease-3 family protein
MEFSENIKEEYDLPDIEPEEVAPLMLAYIGDAVYETVIRTIVISKGNRQMSRVHKDSTDLVNAKAQADMIDAIMDSLTEEELNIYKRGRNQKSETKAKNASVSDYRKATGFEALMGYLFLSKRSPRMLELIRKGLKDVI